MTRRLFCEISPLTYQISTYKEIAKRSLTQLLDKRRYAATFALAPLPVLAYDHKSLIRRTLGQVDPQLQENKAVNLGLAAPKLNGILIRPGETFSFWKLVGSCTAKKGYLEGLIIRRGQVDKGIGGGMCQLTNLIHWMALHSPLDITEHHHHNDVDMFPDFGRQVPFGTGTSILYNYLDYQLTNNTSHTFQLLIHTDETHLCGQLRCDSPLPYSYHIYEKEHFFTQEQGEYYRNNQVWRDTIDKVTGNIVAQEHLLSSHARVLYDPSHIDPALCRSL